MSKNSSAGSPFPLKSWMVSLWAAVPVGEDSHRQFKRDATNADGLAAELAAFANSEGGVIYLGVADDGTTPGLERGDVARLNQLIANAASQNVRSPLTVRTENVIVAEGRVVIVLTIPKGQDKPYFDRSGVIWLESWPAIDFTDDREGCLFTATIRRASLLVGATRTGSLESSQESAIQGVPGQTSSQKGSQKSSQKILNLLGANPEITIAELAKALVLTDRAIKKQIEKLKASGQVRRVGPDKGGHWEVVG